MRIKVLFDWDIAPLTLADALAASRGVLAYLERELAAGEAAGRAWLVAGDAPTIADVCVFPYVAFAEDSSKGELRLGEYPALSRWLSRFKALAGYVPLPGVD